MTTATAKRVQQNYSSEALMDRIKQARGKAGLGSGPLQWSDLVGFDQFHVRGLEATKEMAEFLALTPGQSVLDVGSGLGAMRPTCRLKTKNSMWHGRSMWR